MDSVKIVLILLLCCIGVIIGLFSCSSPDHVEEPGISVKLKYRTVEIVKIRDCEYVFWENGYGSDMEHYGGCVNPAHSENHEDAAKGMRLNYDAEYLEAKEARHKEILGWNNAEHATD